MDELIALSDVNLDQMPQSVRTPRYDRAALTPGIVHIGLGNFHRAHQAFYLHRLLDEGLDHDWAIIGAGVRPGDVALRQKLQRQDWLTTLIELDPAGRSAEIIGPMIDYVSVEEHNAALIDAMSRPEIRIVSLTVTEGGYFISAADGGLDSAHPDVRHDLAHAQTPRTAFGAMIEALRRRRLAGHAPFTALSCDNLQGNGTILRRTIVGMAAQIDGDLARWIDEEGAFPNSMVDCIVPATGPMELALAQSFGVDDRCPVTHENFRQWVIEDDFCAGRPAWEKVGVTFTRDVAAYESMKLRILNGGHQIISIPGDLLSLQTIDQAMAHPAIAAFFDKVMREEIAPHVVAVPDMQPLDYLDLVSRRFANPEIRDTVRRVAFDGSSRQPGFLLPSILDGLRAGTPIEGLALISALWCRYCEGMREDGSVIEPNDPNWDQLNAAARDARSEPMRWLQQTQYYGDLASNTRFADAFTHMHTMVGHKGVHGVLRYFLAHNGAERATA